MVSNTHLIIDERKICHGGVDLWSVSLRQTYVTGSVPRAYFNVPTDTDVLGDLKSVLEGLVTRA